MPEPRSRRSAALLWIAALALMVGAAVWQRLTGPTHPRRGTTAIAGQDVRWRLLRSSVSGEPFMVALPAPEGVTGAVHYRRYPTDEPFREVRDEPRRAERSWASCRPSPRPGSSSTTSRSRRPPGRSGSPRASPSSCASRATCRPCVLIPHVVTMFVSMMIGIRAALAAALGRPEARRYAWVAVVGIAIGGLVLGPIVQKYAFGAYWTGWPFGERPDRQQDARHVAGLGGGRRRPRAAAGSRRPRRAVERRSPPRS